MLSLNNVIFIEYPKLSRLLNYLSKKDIAKVSNVLYPPWFLYLQICFKIFYLPPPPLVSTYRFSC
jgi:hypothetical protein